MRSAKILSGCLLAAAGLLFGCANSEVTPAAQTRVPVSAFADAPFTIPAKVYQALPAADARPKPKPGGPKIFISADMEGIAGVVTKEQLGPSGFEYGRFREFMTQEVLAAIYAAYEAGAGEVLVADSHGNGQNLLIEKLPPEVKVVRSWPRDLMMMQGVEEGFDGAIYIGYHTATTNPEGVRAHTMSSGRFAAVKLNGKNMSEGGVNAAIAGHFGVPIIGVSGDDKVVAETQAIVGDIEGAVVKWAYSFHSAKTLTPAAAQMEIAAMVKAAMGRLDEFKPYKIKAPITVEITFKAYQPAEAFQYLPSIERVDARTIKFVAKDMVEAARFFEFILKGGKDLQP
jgi:D-amino peptidase